MATYNEKLRDPRWQRMRLKVMERDEWACQICYDSKSTLNVHHRFYDFGKDPWDYPIEALATLCEGCHEDETKESARIFGALMAGDTVRASGTSAKVEIWYNADLAQGLYRGLPVVYRAPGTWQMKY